MANKMQILVFGNVLVEGDNLALKLMERLREEFPDVEFIELDPSEELQNYGRNLRIIDAVMGIDEVRVLKLSSVEDFEKVEIGKVYSMHDFDLGYNLKLLKKMKLIDSVEVICLPFTLGEDESEVFNQIQLILRKWVAQDMQGS